MKHKRPEYVEDTLDHLGCCTEAITCESCCIWSMINDFCSGTDTPMSTSTTSQPAGGMAQRSMPLCTNTGH